MAMLQDHPHLKAFKQHGFRSTHHTTDQVVGNCIFCNKPAHFYINPEKKLWDCKTCGRHGGFQGWLDEVHKHSVKNFTGSVAEELSKNRGILLTELKRWGIGYNPANKSYTVPTMLRSGVGVWDLRKYEIGKQLLSTSGCVVGLCGWQHIDKAETIWLCEGEWDTLAVSQYLKGAEIAVGVPGANTFKSEWVQLFQNKIVHCVYDNDKPGQEGALKVYNALISVVKSIDFLVWPAGLPEGFDMRDWQKKHKGIAGVRSMLSAMPALADTTQIEVVGEHEEGLSAEAVHEGYRKFLHIDDTTVIDVLYGTVIANRIEGDPLWLFIIAPPGGFKTELLMSLSKAQKISTTTCLTPHSLISGCNFAGGGDPSLIPKLNNKVLVVKDFTTILNMNQMARDEIFGILRDAYDGKTEKHFGNGVFRSYESKFGIVAGVTPAIELYLEGNAAMGERFLAYKTPISAGLADRKTILKRAISNVGKEVGLRSDLHEIAKRALAFDFVGAGRPVIGPEIEDKLIDLAQYVAMMRGTVVRDKYTREITHKPFSELGTRLAKQFYKLLLGIAMFRRVKEVGLAEFDIVKRIGAGTIPTRIEDFVKVAYCQFRSAQFGAEQFQEIIGLPRATCARVIEDITLLGVFEKRKLSSVKSVWVMKETISQLIKGAGVYGC